MIQNSWGTSWGISGTFMIEQNTDAMCIQNYYTVQMNRFYGFDEDQDKQFIDTNAFSTMNGTYYIDLLKYSVIDGSNGLDFYNETWSQDKTNSMIIVLFVCFGLSGLILIYYGVVWICCPPPNIIKPTIYIKFTEQQGKDFDWSSKKKV